MIFIVHPDKLFGQRRLEEPRGSLGQIAVYTQQFHTWSAKIATLFHFIICLNVLIIIFLKRVRIHLEIRVHREIPEGRFKRKISAFRDDTRDCTRSSASHRLGNCAATTMWPGYTLGCQSTCPGSKTSSGPCKSKDISSRFVTKHYFSF